MKHKQLINFIIIAIIVAFPVIGLAQGPSDPGGDPNVPIDGGLSLLVAAGIGYGAKKAYDARKKQKQAEEK